MDFLPKVTCRRCHRQYSAIRSRCPQCGTKKVRAGDRAVSVAGSPDENMKWQFIFGVSIVSAVILSVMALVLIGIRGGTIVEPTPTVTEAPTETLPPTPSPSPTPFVEKLTITFQGSERKEFAMVLTNPTIELSADVYPLGGSFAPKWSTSNEEIITVARNGDTSYYIVTAHSTGTAEVIVTCGGMTARCKVYVKERW